MPLTPNERAEFELLITSYESKEMLTPSQFDRMYDLGMKDKLVDLAEEYHNFQMVHRLLDQHAQDLNAKVIEGIQIQLKKLGYWFSSEVEFIDFCKENIQRERVTTPYPTDITSYFLGEKNKPHLMPRKLLSVVFQTSLEPERGVVSYSIEMY